MEHGPHKLYPNSMRFDLTAAELGEAAARVIAESQARLDAVVASVEEVIKKHNKLPVSFAETPMQALSDEGYHLSVSPDKAVRDAATEANKTLSAYYVERDFRQDVYFAVKKYIAHLNSLSPSGSWADLFNAEEVYYTKKVLQGFERSGLHLPDDKQTRLKALHQELSEMGIKFQQNLNEDNTSFAFTKDELDGVPESYFGGLKRNDEGKYLVTLKYPDFLPLMKKCKVDETRRLMYTAKQSQCMNENSELFEKTVRLRQECAEILDFKSHAEFVLDVRMAKDPTTVFDFLTKMTDRLEPAFQKDMTKLRALRQKERSDLNLPLDNSFNGWDLSYYINMVLEQDYAINAEEVRMFFPLHVVLSGMLDIFQEILSIRFEELPAEQAHVWHSDVKQYSVFDSNTNDFIGHFYLDLHPREGKYGHAAQFNLQKSGSVGGKRVFPAAACVANFSKPTQDQPSLLFHHEVVTLFHEFGHVMHTLMSEGPFPSLSGTLVQRDFVEAPSQMLENWVYEKEVMLRISRHNQTGEPLPDYLIEKLIAAKNASVGALLRRQLSLGIFDMTVHTLNPEELKNFNSAEYYLKISEKISSIRPPEGTNGAASFGHLMGGYSAGYYGYLWSEVYSADMYSRFKKEGIFNKSVGLLYRKQVLAPGGHRDAIDLLVTFLGRHPTEDAFLEHIGLVKYG